MHQLAKAIYEELKNKGADIGNASIMIIDKVLEDNLKQDYTIYKQYKGENKWIPTTEKDCLNHLEANGWWKEGTVMNSLKLGFTCDNPFTMYKLVYNVMKEDK